ncbi:MAG: SDR family oxidoreductase [Planctomycetes bacterium]|nr:SDR family oxidoreductase [Planctomycetota bacterium]
MKKKIAIFGATGATGRRLVEQSLEQGIEVTVFVRNPGRRPICAQGIKNIIDSMNKNHVSRLAVESAYGARDSKKGTYAKLLYFFLRSVMKDKNEMEKIIEESNLDWIAVRPTILTNGLKTGTYKTGKEVKVKGFPKISRAKMKQERNQNIYKLR